MTNQGKNKSLAAIAGTFRPSSCKCSKQMKERWNGMRSSAPVCVSGKKSYSSNPPVFFLNETFFLFYHQLVQTEI